MLSLMSEASQERMDVFVIPLPACRHSHKPYLDVSSPVNEVEHNTPLCPWLVLQVQLLLQKVRPEWTADTFETVSFVTHGDEQMEGKLRDLGQGAFTGGSSCSKAALTAGGIVVIHMILDCTSHSAVHPAAHIVNKGLGKPWPANDTQGCVHLCLQR
jgi:hypothetical protein